MNLLRYQKSYLASFLTVLAAFSAVAPIDALAQGIPSPLMPGRFERNIAPMPVVPRNQEPEIIANLRNLTEIERQGAADIHFLLHRIDVEGLTIYQPAEISAFYQNLIGKKVSLADVFEAADAISAKYEQDGYLLGRAIIPRQGLEDGILTLQIIEGHIDRILLTGQILGRDERFRKFSEKIVGARPLHASTLQRYLRLAGDLAGTNVKSTLQPSQSTAEAAELILEITHKPVDIVLNVDNRGTRVLGPLRLIGNVGFNGMVSRYGRTEIGLSTDQIFPSEGRIRYISVRHSEVINAEGTEISGAFGGSRHRPGDEFQELKTRIENDEASIEVSHPIKRDEALNVYVIGGFYAENAEARQLDEKIINDDTRVLRAAVVSYLNDKYGGKSAAAIRVSQGLDILGASAAENGEPTPDVAFTKVAVEVSRDQKITEFANLAVHAGAQWTNDDVPLTEEFIAGGHVYGRAYDFGEASGDTGAAASVELQISPKLKIPKIKKYAIYGFYDIAKLWNENDDPSEKIESAGAGLRFDVTDTLSADLSVSKPLSGPVGLKGKDDWRVFFDISMHTEEHLRPPARF